MNNVKYKNAREVALSVLMQITSANAWSDNTLKREIRNNNLDARDAALASRIAYGVIQNYRYLDYYISLWCTQKANKLEPLVLNVLRIGVYQLLFLDKIPTRAAVNETVELVKNSGRPKASGMVNAVLRKVVSNKDKLPSLEIEDKLEQLCVLYSHPNWFVKRLKNKIGIEETISFLETDNKIAPTVIHVNTKLVDADELKQSLLNKGICVDQNNYLKNSFIIAGFGDLEALPEFQNGWFWVQDTAARFVSLVASPKKGDNIIDVCSAPGGKSFSLSEDMEDCGSIISCDIHPHKIQLIKNGANRLHFQSIKPFLADGRVFNPAWNKKFDIAVVDVPCSGLGIIRKKPDIRLKKEKDILQLPQIQAEIIRNASNYVKDGGVLIYSTCTVLSEENENIISNFLKENTNFTKENFVLPVIGECPGDITLWPHRHSTDGFYICKLRKK